MTDEAKTDAGMNIIIGGLFLSFSTEYKRIESALELS